MDVWIGRYYDINLARRGEINRQSFSLLKNGGVGLAMPVHCHTTTVLLGRMLFHVFGATEPITLAYNNMFGRRFELRSIWPVPDQALPKPLFVHHYDGFQMFSNDFVALPGTNTSSVGELLFPGAPSPTLRGRFSTTFWCVNDINWALSLALLPGTAQYQPGRLGDLHRIRVRQGVRVSLQRKDQVSS